MILQSYCKSFISLALVIVMDKCDSSAMKLANDRMNHLSQRIYHLFEKQTNQNIYTREKDDATSSFSL